MLDPLDLAAEPVVVEELVQRGVEQPLDALGAAPVVEAALEGIVLFIISLRMIFPGRTDPVDESYQEDPWFVPIAVPAIAGPAAITTVILLKTQSNVTLYEVLGALTFMIATVGINIVANFVSPAFDFSNVNPQKISWRMGGMIAAVGSVLLTPWNLYSSPEVIHYTLDTLGAFIGPLYGVLIADYYLVKKQRVVVDDHHPDRLLIHPPYPSGRRHPRRQAGAVAAAQLVALSEGGRHVLATAGLTYAEYARSGFFQLLAVAVITLGVLLLLRAATGLASPGQRAVFTVVAEVAVALTLVVVVVAVRRLNLYEDAFGLTMLRLYSELFSYWIGAVFLFLGAALAGVGHGRGWFVGAAVAAGLTLLLALNVVNPEAVVAGDHPDGDAPRPQDEGVQAVLAGRPAIEPRLDRHPRVRVGDRPARVARTGVIPDEQGDIERRRAIRPGPGTRDHRPGLLSLEHPRGRVEVGRQQVVHVPVAVVHEDVRRAGGQRALDGGIRLTDHQVDRNGIAPIRRVRRVRVVHPGDALHVDADVDPHEPSSGPVRAACPIPT